MALHQVTLAIFENNVGVSDAVLLDPLTEDNFISNLHDRFNHDQIYVSTKGSMSCGWCNEILYGFGCTEHLYTCKKNANTVHIHTLQASC